MGSKGAQAGRRCVEQLQIMSQRSGEGPLPFAAALSSVHMHH